MSQYKDKLAKKTASVPLKYTELIKKYQEITNYNGITTMNMTVIDLKAQEDYDKLTAALNEMEGVEGVGAFQPKKLSVTYDPNQTNLESIVHKISIMGYRYVNRF